VKITKEHLRKIIKEEISNIVQEDMLDLVQKIKRDLGPQSQADEELKQAFRKKYARKANLAKRRSADDPWGMQWVLGMEKIG
jgi:hemoglobin-like flavoprotein